jgi:hypothetical protein
MVFGLLDFQTNVHEGYGFSLYFALASVSLAGKTVITSAALSKGQLACAADSAIALLQKTLKQNNKGRRTAPNLFARNADIYPPVYYFFASIGDRFFVSIISPSIVRIVGSPSTTTYSPLQYRNKRPRITIDIWQGAKGAGSQAKLCPDRSPPRQKRQS